MFIHSFILNPPQAVGILQVICEIIKSGPSEEVQAKIPAFFAIPTAVEQSTVLEGNTVIRKLKIKLLSRLALRMLPAGGARPPRKGTHIA